MSGNIKEPYLLFMNENITDKPGKLTCINNSDILFDIKRVFYIYGFSDNTELNKRGKHGHKNTTQILISLSGTVNVFTYNVLNNGNEKCFELNKPNMLLVIPPNNYIKMEDFSKDAILLVLCDTEYKDDIYFY